MMILIIHFFLADYSIFLFKPESIVRIRNGQKKARSGSAKIRGWQSIDVALIGQEFSHRRRIKTEAKAMVVACVWR